MDDVKAGADVTKVCIDCNTEFLFTVRDQEFYKVHGYVEPRRCYSCRKKKKQRYENYKSRKTYIGDAVYPKITNE